MTLQVDWVKHLTGDRRDDFEKTLRNNTLVFRRMNEILTEWEQSLLTEERSKEQYKTAAWGELQAHRNGNLEIIKKMKDLISF